MIAGGSKCQFAGGGHGPCEPPLQWHHAIKQQRLKRAFPRGAWRSLPDMSVWRPVPRGGLVAVMDGGIPCGTCLGLDDILGDTRNRIWLCSRHHELVTNGRLKVQLPESVWLFAAEFGLTAQLENDIARSA